MRSFYAFVLVPASLRDLHRHSCQHFHFSFLAFFAPSYPHFVSQWISFLSSPPSRARAPLYVMRLPPFSFPRAYFILFFYFSFLPFFLAAHIFFSRDAEWNMRARVRHRERERARPSLFDFPREFFVLAPSLRRLQRDIGGKRGFPLDRAEGDR